MPGLASKKFAGLRWNPVVSTGITGLHVHTALSAHCHILFQSKKGHALASVSLNTNIATTQAHQSSRRGTCVTPKECHTTTSLFLMLRSCNKERNH